MEATLLITGGTVLGLLPDQPDGVTSLRVRDGRIRVPGPAAETFDAHGCTVVPLVVATLEEDRREPYRERTVAFGNEATFAVVSRRVTEREAKHALVVAPPDLRLLVLAGRVAVRDGAVVPDAPMTPATGDPWLGAWTDRTGFLTQTLDATGRYDETRAGRRHAYQGRYWVHGPRIVYLDDTGFWAFGELDGATLHHAGYVMSR